MRANRFVTRRQFVGAASSLAASFFVTGCSGAQTGSSKEEVASETGAEETRTPEGAQAAPSAGGARQAQAAVVFFSLSLISVSAAEISQSGNPSERTRMIPSSDGVTAAIISISTAAASTLPCW